MLIYLIGINTLCFILMGYDKLMSIKNKSRIPEITLITLSFLGGGLFSLFGMYFFHHKTQKLKFKILIPISSIETIILLINLL